MSTPLQAALLCFSAELGDKSFFLTAILAAWCPFRGVRSGPGALSQQCLVAAGSASALAAHVLLLLASGGVSNRVSWVLGSLAFIVQAALGLQALMHLHKADRSRQLATATDKATAAAEAGDGGLANAAPTKTLLGSFKAYDPQAYGATQEAGGNPSEAKEAGGVESEEEKCTNTGYLAPNAAGVLAAFGVPFLCIFMAEPSDRSLDVVRAASTVTSSLGALGGCALAIIVAVSLGYLLERHLSERRLLFAAALGLWALWLVTMSQDILQFYGNYTLSMNESPLPPIRALVKSPALAQAHAKIAKPALRSAAHFPRPGPH